MSNCGIIKRSGVARDRERKTVGDVLQERFRDKANERAEWWAKLLEINIQEIHVLPFPTDANGSVDGVNRAVKKKFAALIKSPKVMAKVLGAKDD